VKQDIQDLETQIQTKIAEIGKLEAKAALSDREVKLKKVLEANLEALYNRLATKREDLTRFSYPAHKILADRMAKRDPGNAPASGERMGFIYIAPPAGQLAPKLQGDRIETPEYIKEKKLQPDYKYYIEHQLENPIGQLFGLVVEQIPGYVVRRKAPEGGERDAMASELLFRKAFQECDKGSRHAFVARFGGAVAPQVHEENFGGNVLVTPEPRRSSRIAEQVQKPQVQTTLNSYFVHKAMLDQYKEVKAATASQLKEEKKKKKK
jgi:hypothetical protein